jgi:hypothetical protein
VALDGQRRLELDGQNCTFQSVNGLRTTNILTRGLIADQSSWKKNSIAKGFYQSLCIG